MDFENLREARQALKDAVLVHRDSLLRFQAANEPWFHRDASLDPEPKQKTVRHLSTTASCLESLADIPSFQEEDIAQSDHAASRLKTLLPLFAKAALAADDEEWESEGAARVYCRVRTLPVILSQASSEILDNQADRACALVRFVWERVDPGRPEKQGVAEDPIQGSEDEGTAVRRESPIKSEERLTVTANPDRADSRQAYPPNAFHGYWALRMLQEYERRELPDLKLDIATKREVVHLWAERTLALQAALIPVGAQRIDAHQLAWALATDLLRDPEPPATSASPRRELYEAALSAFFAAQLGSGGWPRSEPLFHYPKAGNAYCYTYETLTELLRPALDRDRGHLMRGLLRPYVENLLKAWEFAERTKIELGNDQIGWCSGHHPQRTHAEAWATAAVFSFAQAFRRLVGLWTAEAAESSLDARRAKWQGPNEARKVLAKRGDTWVRATTAQGHVVDLSAGQQLAALFLHPITAHGQGPELDPDSPRVGESQARSAILFGPPGTSKTTLIEALAGAIGWRFVEIHASDFLSEGMDRVPARADRIFDSIMELDQCVILFDEIDELIRERSASETDPFGRFLTTSMLPKLAQLWDQRRVLFFVATNHIEVADSAVRRSQRFDSAIFVAPPSFRAKVAQLGEYLGAIPAGLTFEAVSRALNGSINQDPLGTFALLRHDQLRELAIRAKQQNGDTVTLDAIRASLRSIAASIPRFEPEEMATDGASDTDPYAEFRAYRSRSGRDFRMERLIHFQSEPPSVPEDWNSSVVSSGHYFELVGSSRDDLQISEAGLRLSFDSWEAEEDGLLSFKLL